MTQVAPRKQKRIQREADIISATMNLLKDCSFMELKMSDVAKAAECSMGAIYSHFSSKEDLLLGCATLIMNQRLEKIRALTCAVTDPLDQALLCCFMFWHEDNRSPRDYELCHLAWNPSIWQRASSQRSDEMNKVGKLKAQMLTGFCKRVFEERLHLPQTDNLIDEFMMSLGGLSIGIFHFKESSLGVSDSFVSAQRSSYLLIDCLARVLKGWDIESDDLKEDLWNLFHYTTHKLDGMKT